MGERILLPPAQGKKKTLEYKIYLHLFLTKDTYEQRIKNTYIHLLLKILTSFDNERSFMTHMQW